MNENEDPNQRIVKSGEDARQGSSHPRQMPTVLLVSTVGAFIVCLIVYLIFFG